MKMMFVMTAFFFVVAEGLFRIMFYNTVAKVRTYVRAVYSLLYSALELSHHHVRVFHIFIIFISISLLFPFLAPSLHFLPPLTALLSSSLPPSHLPHLLLPLSPSSTPQNALTFIPYFFTGTFAASVLENMHVAMWDWKRKEAVKAKSKQLLTLTPAV